MTFRHKFDRCRGTVTSVAVLVVPWKRPEPPFMVLGIVSNVMWGDSFSRRLWIRETWKTYANVGKTVHVVFIVALLQSNLSPIPKDVEERLRAEAEEHGDMLLLSKVPERKSPCLKTMAWFRHAVRTYPTATFLAKTDDDAFVQTIKLEANMRPFANSKRVYIGSTLWGSYITKTFEPCARRMGPNMCAGGMQEEKCKERGAIGPYPYAVGMLQVLSYDVAAWMVVQEEYAEFERRATAATRPPMMDQGEDMVIGMFLYLSPWPLMPLHWGWDKLHDLCFNARKDQPAADHDADGCAHHIANEEISKPSSTTSRTAVTSTRHAARRAKSSCYHSKSPPLKTYAVAEEFNSKSIARRASEEVLGAWHHSVSEHSTCSLCSPQGHRRDKRPYGPSVEYPRNYPVSGAVRVQQV